MTTTTKIRINVTSFTYWNRVKPIGVGAS